MVFILVIVVFFAVARLAWHKTASNATSTKSRITARTITVLALVPLVFVENRTDRPYGNVQVQIDLLDAAGDVVGFSIAATRSIPGGEAWRFDAPVDGEGAVGFRTKVESPENRRPAWLGGCATTIC